VYDGHSLDIKGTFHHQSCVRFAVSKEPFQNLSCCMCYVIPQEKDFRMCVVREARCIEKRGSRGIGDGRRLGYLAVAKLCVHSRRLKKELRLHKMYRWAAKLRVVQLKVKRPTLREFAKESSNRGDIIKFCNNILAAHRVGAFGGKLALWDFMKDVASNLNRKKQGYRFSSNFRSFVQAMKIYGGTGLNTIKSDNRKGFHFLLGEHPGVFKAVVDVYRCAMLAHGITGLVPVILAEDETKVKSRVSWESKWDTLAGFCRPKQNHVCISSYKPVVGFGKVGYNTIVDSFRTNKIGGFARIIVVNPLHEKLPRLVLVVCYTCNYFDST
jgi:hypothetical protein